MADLAELWTYRPPTPTTTPKYEAIRLAEAKVQKTIRLMQTGSHVAPSVFDAIRDVTLGLAQAVEAHAPEGRDRDMAIESCRLVRMLLNEAAVLQAQRVTDLDGTSGNVYRLLDRASIEATTARMWACSAISLDI